MQRDELVQLLAEPAVVQALRDQLGLPAEPVAAELRALQEGQARLEARMERLEDAILRLTEAQARTELRMDQLTQRMDQLAERMDQLAERMDQLTERVDQLTERVDQLTQRMDQLTERTDQLGQRVDQLVESQARADARINQLTERMEAGFARMEAGFERLTSAIVSLRKEVGALSSTVGSWVEDALIYGLPSWLLAERGLRVEGDLELGLFRLRDGSEHEVDGTGFASAEGERVRLVCEAKSRVHPRDVDDLVRLTARVGAELPEPLLGILLGQWVHPDARARGKQAGVVVVSVRDVLRAA